MLDDETRYRLLKRLQADPDVSQRALAQELGISLGKLNYCLRAVIDKGWVKAANFRNSRNKKAYAYYLTPQGIDEKARVTGRFLKRKIAEYEAVQREIEELRREVAVTGSYLGLADGAAGKNGT
jgi:EPS-associated MarR family transcriptional regulator